MDGYHIALFIHLVALFVAGATSGVVGYAGSRFGASETAGEALQWLKIQGGVAKRFPVAVITLLLTGGYMTTATGVWSWSLGWIQAGTAAAILLLVAGATIGIRSKAMGMALGQLAQRGHTRAELVAAIDPVPAMLGAMNHGLALAVVFDMATKPAPVTAFSVLLIGAVAGLVLNRVAATRRATAAATVSA